MEEEVNRIIKDIETNKNKNDKWYFETCEKIANILKSSCAKELKDKLCGYSDSVFMMRDTLWELKKNYDIL